MQLQIILGLILVGMGIVIAIKSGNLIEKKNYCSHPSPFSLPCS